MAIWQPLIVCNVSPVSEVARYPDIHARCEFPHLILLVQNLITDLIILSTILATAVFIFAGFKLLTSGGNPKALTETKAMLLKVVKGYIWILIAWLLIYTIINALLRPGYSLLGTPQ